MNFPRHQDRKHVDHPIELIFLILELLSRNGKGPFFNISTNS